MFQRFFRDDHGGGAAEFALILPALLFLLLGTVNLFAVVYAQTNLHSSVEAGARYWSVQTAAGTTLTATQVQTYAGTQYIGPRINQTYVATQTGTCGSTGANGYSVSATATYGFYYGFGSISMPLAARACFP
jgi:Flp pilus assembly protein TadG